MAHARIRSVCLKAGGAQIRVLHNNAGERGGEIVEHARSIAAMSEPGSALVGFVTIGLFGDGRTSVGWHYDQSSAVVPSALLPMWVSEVIRRDLITAREAEGIACHVINRANGFET